MHRPPVPSMVISVTILGFVPVLIAFGVNELPSVGDILASHTADILGVWLITWGLILLGIVGTVTVSWLAWTADAATRQLEDRTRVAVTPGGKATLDVPVTVAAQIRH